MGKSTASGILERLGFGVVDTDDIARAMVAKGQPALEQIRDVLGAEFIRSDGSLDRARLAEVVFGDANARKTLEGILHPRIRACWEARVEEWRLQGLAIGVVVIPLLFEIAVEARFDAVVCVACSAKSQRHRLRERGWTEAHVEGRLSAQLPVELKMQKAGFVVWTEPPVAVHEAQLRQVLATMGVGVGLTPGPRPERFI